MDDTYCESNDDLINAALSAGFSIGPQDIVRTLRGGLIQRPHQFAHGRGQGTTVRYPAGTANQLVLVLRLREGRRRPLSWLRWCTWWNGGVIPEKWIRAELLLAAERGVRDRAQMLAAADTSEAGDEARERLEASSAVALRKLPAQIRGHFRGLSAPPLITMALQLVEGIPPDPMSVQETLGELSLSPILPAEQDLLTIFSKTFREADFATTAASVPLPVLQQLRDELRVVAAVMLNKEPSFDDLPPRQAKLFKQMFSVSKLLIASSDVLLIWTVLRSTGQAGDVLLGWFRKTAAEHALLGSGA